MHKNSILISLALFLIVAFAASSEAVSIEFSVKASGSRTVIVQNQTVFENCTPDVETNATECMNQTITMENKIKEPWEKSKTMDIECNDVCSYPIPSFNAPSDVDVEKYELSTTSSENIHFEESKTKTTTNPEDKIVVEVKTAKQVTELILDRILPSTVSEGSSQVNLFVVNNGTEAVNYFNVTIIGAGSGEVSEGYSDKLEPGQMAIVPVSLNFSGAGQKEIVARLTWKIDKVAYNAIYSYRINVLASQTPPEAKVNSTEIIERFNADKEMLKNYELEYSQKKAEGYLVQEVYDSIRNAKEYLATVQLLVEEEKYSDARLKLALLDLSLEDTGNGLKNALKTKQTFADKLKANALLISSVIAALVAVISIYERQKTKIGALKEKLIAKKMAKTEVKEAKKEEPVEKKSEKAKKAMAVKKQKQPKAPKEKEDSDISPPES